MTEASPVRRPGTGLVLAFVGTLVVSLVASAGVAAVAPTPPPAAAAVASRVFNSTTGRFTVGLPSSYTVQADGEDDDGRLFFAAGAGDGYGDFEDEGVSLVLVPVKPGSVTSPTLASDLREAMDSLTSNAQRCEQSDSGRDGTAGAITPPAGGGDHDDWEWQGCPNGWVERDFAYFEQTGRYGVVVAARAKDSTTARDLVSQALTGLDLTG